MNDPFPPTARGPRQTNIVNMRLRPSGIEWLQKQAKSHGVTQTEIIKAALAFAGQSPEKFSALIAARK